MKQKKDFTEKQWQMLTKAVSEARLYLMKLLIEKKRRARDQQ